MPPAASSSLVSGVQGRRFKLKLQRLKAFESVESVKQRFIMFCNVEALESMQVQGYPWGQPGGPQAASCTAARPHQQGRVPEAAVVVQLVVDEAHHGDVELEEGEHDAVVHVVVAQVAF